MSDYIKREDAMAEFATNGSATVYGIDKCKAIISRLQLVPTADVVEVVRCRYCKHRDTNECPYDTVNYMLADSDFCSSGERADT